LAFEDLGTAQKQDFYHFLDALNDFVARALRTMLIKDQEESWHLHPDVPAPVRKILIDWVLTHRGIGNRSLLRRTKTGIEKGVKRPRTLKEVEFLEELRRLRRKEKEEPENATVGKGNTISEILHSQRRFFDPERHRPSPNKHQPQKKSWRSVFHILSRRGTIPPMSYRNFLKIIKTLDPLLLKD
jgi:hypothetical protein